MPSPRTRSITASIIAVLVMLAAPSTAAAHGEAPRAFGFAFTEAHPGAVFTLTDGQGIFANLKGPWRWLCEDAVSPQAGMRGLYIEPEGQGWAVATTLGGFISDDGGCGFTRMEGPVGAHRLIGLWQHPDADDLWTASATPGFVNDLYRSEDGGRTWTAAGLALPQTFRVFLRAPSAPDTIYASHSAGAIRSVDGGRTFEPLTLGAPVVEENPRFFRLLAVHPEDPLVVFAAFEALPETFILRSNDGGMTWAEVTTIREFGLSMLFDPGSDEVLLAGPVEPPKRSLDGGITWMEDPDDPLPRCMVHGPAGRLWGCRDPYFGAAYAVAYSEDVGRTWERALTTYEDVAERWDCSNDTRAHTCCAGLCPGAMVPPEACGQPQPDPDLAEVCALAADEGELIEIDAGPPDMALPDAGRPDAAVVDQGGPLGEPSPDPVDGGCAVATSRSTGESIGLLALLLAGLVRRRRP